MPTKKKSNAGRPIQKVTLQTYIDGEVKCTVDTLRELSNKDKFDEILSALIGGFQRDLNVEEACIEAGINKDTFYNWINASDELANRVIKARQRLKTEAKKIIADKIINNKDFEAAKWWAERKLKNEYSTRQEYGGSEEEIKLKQREIEAKETLANAATALLESRNNQTTSEK